MPPAQVVLRKIQAKVADKKLRVHRVSFRRALAAELSQEVGHFLPLLQPLCLRTRFAVELVAYCLLTGPNSLLDGIQESAPLQAFIPTSATCIAPA